MFTDSDPSCVEFMPLPRTQRKFQECSQQTEAFRVKDNECQTFTLKTSQVQTGDFSKDLVYESHDESRLCAFLKHVTPSMLQQLQRNLHSHAFDRYDMQFGEEEKKLTRLHTLTCNKFTEQMKCSGVSWNAAGSVIAVAYTSLQHDGWCTHSAGLSVWNLNRRDFSPTNPSVFLENNVCLTCLQFHPIKPALIVGGNYNGNLTVWNLADENDAMDMKTVTSDLGHSEVVTSVYWGQSSKHSLKCQVSSSGLDGKILMWQYNERASTLQLVKGFIILAENMPKELKASKKNVVGEIGVNSMSFSHGDRSMFFLGLEGGGVVQCTANSEMPAVGHLVGNVQLMSPLVLTYTPHPGYLNDVKCAPFVHHLFATCSLDGELHLYSISQTSPVLIVHYQNPLMALAWSPVRPVLLASVTSKGEIVMFTLKSADADPDVQEVLDKNEQLCTIQFNQKNFRLLATGDNRGAVNVWQLSEDYANCGPNENKFLMDFGRIAAD